MVEKLLELDIGSIESYFMPFADNQAKHKTHLNQLIMAAQTDRQKRIMEHLSRSTMDFSKLSLSSEQRKQQILEHVRLSKG